MHGQPQILDSIFSLFFEGVAGKPGGGLQGAGGGVPERRLVFARDHDPQALNLQQADTQVRPKSGFFLSHLGTRVKVFFFGGPAWNPLTRANSNNTNLKWMCIGRKCYQGH